MNTSSTPQSAKPDVPGGSMRSHEAAGSVSSPARSTLTEDIRQVRADLQPAVAEFVGQVEHRARDSAQRVGEQARGLRDDGAEYIRRRPLQSLLIAAGVGAALMLSLRLLGRIAASAR
jgi:ElaB/YqjD/DUF883 family membrane-anchored ribosome-binding protein